MQTIASSNPETTVPKYLNMYAHIDQITRRDYAGATTNPNRGRMNQHQGMIASTFDQTRWDHLFIHAANRFISEFRDRQLRLIVQEGRNYRPFSNGFRVRNDGEFLYISEVTGPIPVSPGEKITALNGYPFDAFYERVRNWLFNPDPERQVWAGVLKTVQQITVEHKNGRVETLDLPTCSPFCERYENTFTWLEEGIAYLRIQNTLDPDAFTKLIWDNAAGLARSHCLVIDLRRNIGGSETALYPLIPYLIDRPVSLSELVDSSGMITNYSENNCRLQIERIQKIQPETPDEAIKIQSLINDLCQKSGTGYQFEAGPEIEEDQIFEPVNPEQRVVVLLDTWCENAGETFASICARLPKVTLLGRPSMGCTDYSNLVIRKMSDRFTFVYPMSRSARVDQGLGLNGRGVSVHNYHPWTPEECVRDVLLAKALQIS